GAEPGRSVSPPTIALGGGRPVAGWPLDEASRTGELVVVDDLSSRFPEVPPGPWSAPPQRGIVVPIRSSKVDHLAGFLVAGVSARLRLDDLYRTFFDLIATQIATSIANARAHEEERRRAEALAEIDRAKTAFFSNVSHEFRTPLTLILASLEDLLAKQPRGLARDVQGLGAVAHRNSLRLLKLVNTLLDFSRIEAGRVQASYEPIELATVTAETVSNFRSACERAGLALNLDCEPLGKPVYVDREMWEKIVLNLVSNAFKYTHSGAISVTLRCDANDACLAVADTGIGISEEEIPRLFERFHRVEGANGRTHEGTGIGLALVQELVRLHGGSVAVQSAPGRGSTFTVHVPLGTAHLPRERIRASPILPSTAIAVRSYVEEALRWLPSDGTDALRGEFGIDRGLLEDRQAAAVMPMADGECATILVVDDNADMRDYLQRLLAARYRVHPVADGEMALAALREHRFDLVLSDVMMPRLDGFGLLRAVRSDPAFAEIPVVLLSARAGEEASIGGLEAGADDYLFKPFSARELQARVAANLELVRLRRRRRQVEDDLRAQDALTRTVLETTPECMMIVAADAKLIYMNEAGLRIVGAETAEQVCGSFIRDLIAPEDRDSWRGFHDRVCCGERLSWEFEVIALNGARRRMETHAAPLRMADRGIVQLAITRDVTQTRLQEQELRAGEERLRHLNETLEQRVAEAVAARDQVQMALFQAQKLEALGQLTGGVAHDFNNLLTAMIGHLEASGGGDHPTGKRRRHIEAATRAAERGAKLTQQLLAYARRQHLEPLPIDLNGLIGGLDDMLRRTLGGLVNIETRLADDLWYASSDPTQIELAILNLAINARDAMPLGGSLYVETRNIPAGDSRLPAELQSADYIQLVISDTGEGMTSEVLQKAMDPFFTTKEIGKGSGLGLSQVSGVIRQCGGTIRLDSARGEGTTVLIWLPRSRQAPSEAEWQVNPVGPIGRRGNVLVVDDDDAVRGLAVEVLREAGYHSEEAASGAKALDILAAGIPIDLAVVDYAMPRMSGTEFVRAARERFPDLPAVYISGYADREQMKRDTNTVIVKKPYRAADLLGAVQRALEDRHHRAPTTNVVSMRSHSVARRE
ncbi:MAG: response regulator, partial [Alphaproteobacteria bacterium]|nr:response regulator [Alphaproteobacteria bacterium]